MLRIILYTVVIFTIASYGFALGKYKIFPYEDLKTFARVVRPDLHIGERSAAESSSLLASQYKTDRNAIAIGRELDTALLPLRICSVPIKKAEAIAAMAGGIAMVADHLVVMDRLGKFYQCNDDCSTLANVPLPPLPNNLLEYVSEIGTRLDERSFRAHSVRFLGGENKLAVSHEYFDTKLRSVRFAVSVIEVDPESLRARGQWETVFLGDPEPVDSEPVEAGGALAWERDGKLLVTAGDFQTELRKTAQDPRSTFGKIFEIDLRTHIHRVVSWGLRNPEGLIFSESLGLLSVEHGPEGGDRLMAIAEGANYGWPNVSLGTDYGRYSFGQTESVGRLDGYASPLFAWVPSIAPTELIEVRGFDKRWDGDLLVASLKAQSLFRLRLDKSRVVYCEPIFIGKRIRDVISMNPQTIALWTDDAQLVFISVDRDRLASGRRYSPELDSDLMHFCLVCHHFGPTNEADFAPSLSGLIGRPIASDRFRYSAGLRSVPGNWDPETLRRFLSDPGGFATGTSMPPTLLGPPQIDELVHEFERLSRNGDEFGRQRRAVN